MDHPERMPPPVTVGRHAMVALLALLCALVVLPPLILAACLPSPRDAPTQPLLPPTPTPSDAPDAPMPGLTFAHP